MPKPICFMVMPYGKRPTGVAKGKGPDAVDFDAFWEKAICPALEHLGYEPVRADQDVGALIIKEMLERLAIADLVVAEVTIPNANVYYEVGVRHAAKKTGCVLLAADWSKQLFDIAQMPHLRYSLPEEGITDENARTICTFLEKKLPAFIVGESPVFQSVPGFPDDIDESRTTSFRDFAKGLSQFQGRIKAIRLAPKRERKQRALALLEDYPPFQPTVPAIVIELFCALRDFVSWETALDYIVALPKEFQNLPIIQEQRYLALSKTGNPVEAIGALEAVVEQFGDSSERQGLIGGRYKKLYQQADNDADRADYLDLAIEHYERGMNLDLNDYYPSCNLPRLYRVREAKGDEDRARIAATIALAACERALKINPNNPWIRPTLLGAAFDTGNVTDAQRLLKEIRRGRPADWQLRTTFEDLKTSARLHTDPKVKEDLGHVLHELESLI